VERLPQGPPGETEKERLDRNLNELLGELRVALPGVQVLFAFLLTVPFNQRFAHVTQFQKNVYFVTLLCAAGASICLIATTVHHRVTFRQRQRPRLVQVGNTMAIIGLAFLAVAIVGAVLLVTDVLFGVVTTVIATSVVALAILGVWYVMPLRRSLG
jgi:putative flippase GtrA